MRLSGRPCWNFLRGSCAYGDDCRYLHDAVSDLSAPDRARPSVDSSSTAPPPRRFALHKAQQQLGANPDASLLSKILTARGGWIRTKDPSETSLLWGMSFTTGALYDDLPPGALVNHFPNTVAVTHKHRLVASLRAVEGGDDVAPVGFALPGETEAFLDHDRRVAGSNPSGGDARWILKRAVGGEGKGIAVFGDAAAVVAAARADADARDCPAALPIGASASASASASAATDATWRSATHVVQAYVPRPLLVNGRKVDLRAYVLVTSWGGDGAAASDEIRAYLYDEGLVRFAAAPYDASDLSVSRHLTNNAVSTSRDHQMVLAEGPDADAHFKRNWTFAALRDAVEEERGEGSFDGAWEGVREAIRTVLRAAAPAVRAGLDAVAARDASRGRSAEAARRHFELLGADVLLDENLRAWLLEVNSAPSLVAGTKHRGRVSETHHHLKAGLIADLLNVVDAGGVDGRPGADAEAERAARGRFKPVFDGGGGGARSKRREDGPTDATGIV